MVAVLGEGVAESVQVLVALLGAPQAHGGSGAWEPLALLLLAFLLGLHDAKAALTQTRQPGNV